MNELVRNFLMEAMFNPLWILFKRVVSIWTGSFLVILGIHGLQIPTILKSSFKWKNVLYLFLLIWGIMCIVNGYNRGYPG